MRPIVPLAAAIALALGLATSAGAQQTTLPDIGSSAGELLSPQEEIEYGAYALYQLRSYNYVLEDPLIEAWLDEVGHRLAAASDRPEQHFKFFLMRDRQINAFATLGGYVGVNAGIMLSARNEGEVAGVLAHEISHVTQRHVLRSVERAQKDQIPIILATLGVIVAAQQGSARDSEGNRNSGDAIQAAVMGGQALAMQRQIDYTRTSEAEADRVGIQTLDKAGYDADGMADFFERMDRLTRGNSGGYNVPSYLRTHPVNTTRLSEARDRAARLQQQRPAPAVSTAPRASLLLPWGLTASDNSARPTPGRMFEWAQERLRVLTASSPAIGLREAKIALEDAGARATDAQRYGFALANMKAAYPAAAEAAFESLAGKHPDNLWIGLALAENAGVAKNEKLARQRFEALLARHPDDRAITVSYAQALNAQSTADSGRRAQEILRPILAANADDPVFQKNFARASELAGDLPRAGEAYAEAAFLNGRAEDALNQLNAVLKRNDVSYIQRARIEARIAEITPEVLDMQRRRIKPQDLPPDRG